MREAYRLNKSDFYQELVAKNLQLAIMFVYIGKDITEYPAIEKGMLSAFKSCWGKFSENGRVAGFFEGAGNG